jgi:hypothetical protein
MRSLLLVGAAAAVAVTPVEKVTELLVKLQAKTEEEGQAEAVAYDKFACFCKEQASNKLYAIEQEDKAIAKLEAKIEELSGEIEKLDQEVKEGNQEIKDLEEESEAAIKLRADERVEFEKAYASINRAIKASKRAVEALQQSRPDAMLVQEALGLALIQADSSTQQKLLASFAKEDPAAYKYHSSEIIQLLQDLIKQFKAKAEKIYSEESTSKHAHNMEEQQRQNTIKFTQQAVDSAAKTSATKNEEKSAATDDKNESTDDRNADQAFLDDLTKQCEDKAKSFDQRSSTRSNELQALAEAIALLKGAGGENYGANKKLNLLARRQRHGNVDDTEESEDAEAAKKGHDAAAKKAKKVVTKEDLRDVFTSEEWADEQDEDAEEDAAMFLQTGSVSVKNSRVFNFIKSRAKSLKSTALTALAMNLKKDHFVKVRGMINDMISKLEAQAEAEATAKQLCDEEMKEAITQRDEANIKVEQETSAIATNEAMIAKLTKEIKELSEAIASLKKALRERTELRNEEKKENEVTIADAEEGEQAIADAIKVLKGFYGESFLSVEQAPGRGNIDSDAAGPAKDRNGDRVEELAPETFEGDYDGNQDSAKGIFGLLNVIQSDYKRTIESTKQAEEDATAEFKDYEDETNGDIDTKTEEKGKKTDKKADENADMSTNQDDLADAEEELKLAKEKLGVLKAKCVDDTISHEERLARRKDEVESLKEALNILEEMSFLQRRN